MLTEDIKNIIIKAAIAAPSADNSQPFKFQWHTDGSLNLWIDKSRSGKASDNRFILSDIALGAVIENIAVQSLDLGYEVDVNYFPNGKDDELYITNIKFNKLIDIQLNKVSLANEIYKRCTDRRFPFKGPISQSNRDDLSTTAQIYGCNTIWFDDKKSIKRTLPVIQQAESIRFKSKTLHQELFSTVKFSKEDTQEGMHISVLAIEKPAQPFFKLMKKWSFMNMLNKIGGATMLGIRSVRIPIMFSPALLLITIKDKDRLSVIKAGRAIQRVWLQATQFGLSVQPYAAPGIFSLGFIDCEDKFRDDLINISEKMKDLVNTTEQTSSHYGLMFLRVGIHQKSLNIKSLRREVTSFQQKNSD